MIKIDIYAVAEFWRKTKFILTQTLVNTQNSLNKTFH